MVKYTLNTFKALNQFANFDEQDEVGTSQIPEAPTVTTPTAASETANKTKSDVGSIGLNLGYTINLNLPATSDQAVFNAIFKSLKEHLLSSDDA